MTGPVPTPCSEVSLRHGTDAIPPDTEIYMLWSAPCEHCGHKGCYPRTPCDICVLHDRINRA